MAVGLVFSAATLICVVPILWVMPASARMEAMGETEMARVTAQAGITMVIDAQGLFTADTIKISDSGGTPNWIELRGFAIDDGAGDPFSLATPVESPNTIDVATDTTGRTVLTLTDASHTQPRWYSVASLVFAGQELGSLRAGPVTMGPSTLRLSSHQNGTTGIDFDYATRLDIGSFQHRYNSTSASLTLAGIHLFGSATGNQNDDPGNPATWELSGNFRVGDITGNPATFDVATDGSGTTSAYLNLPVQGSLRVEEIGAGGASLGPAAIDGINVHRLQLRITP